MNHFKTAMILLAFVALGLGVGVVLRDHLARGADGVDVVTLDRSIAGVPATAQPVMLSLSTCPVCRQARTWLGARNIAHTELVLDESEDARRLADRLGVVAVPVFLIGEQQITGFDPKLLETLLRPR